MRIAWLFRHLPEQVVLHYFHSSCFYYFQYIGCTEPFDYDIFDLFRVSYMLQQTSPKAPLGFCRNYQLEFDHLLHNNRLQMTKVTNIFLSTKLYNLGTTVFSQSNEY